MSDDYLGRERTEDQIASLALSWRQLFGVDAEVHPDVLWCVEVGLPRRFPHFALMPRPDDELPNDFAIANYAPPRIDIRESAYIAANQARPRARFILTHELGHVVLHDHVTAKHLKDGTQERMRIARMSMENQADEFAQHFLVPEHIARRMSSIGEIMRHCGVTYSIAVKAGLCVGIRPSRKLQPYEVMALDTDENDDFDV